MAGGYKKHAAKVTNTGNAACLFTLSKIVRTRSIPSTSNSNRSGTRNKRSRPLKGYLPRAEAINVSRKGTVSTSIDRHRLRPRENTPSTNSPTEIAFSGSPAGSCNMPVRAVRYQLKCLQTGRGAKLPLQ
jgi:hypothetical protein